MMRLHCSILAAAFLASSCCNLVSAQSKFTVGTASAAPGQKSTGTLEVPAGVDAATSIPVVVVNGAKPGKVLALVSGAHGTEYVSIIAIEKLIAALDPAQVTGTVILVPLINIQSFEQKVPHVNPVDNKSMNRFYPGKPDGTQTQLPSGETRFAQTGAPGIYTVTSAQPPVSFAVNLDPAESRTAPLPIDGLERLSVPLKPRQIELTRQLDEKRRLHDSELENQQKLWRWLTLAALVVLLCETGVAGWLARRTTFQTGSSI